MDSALAWLCTVSDEASIDRACSSECPRNGSTGGRPDPPWGRILTTRWPPWPSPVQPPRSTCEAPKDLHRRIYGTRLSPRPSAPSSSASSSRHVHNLTLARSGSLAAAGAAWIFFETYSKAQAFRKQIGAPKSCPTATSSTSQRHC